MEKTFKNLDELYNYINNDDGFPDFGTSILDRLEVALDYERLLTDWKQEGNVWLRYDGWNWRVTVSYTNGTETRTLNFGN